MGSWPWKAPLLSLAACHIIAQYESGEPTTTYWDCSIEHVACPVTGGPLVASDVQISDRDRARLNPALFHGAASREPWFDEGYVVDALPAELQGSAQLVQTPFEKRNEASDSDTFTIDWPIDAIETIYLAFDERALAPPAWLTSGSWEPTPLVAEVSLRDELAGRPTTRFVLHRARLAPGSRRSTLGNNAATGARWPTGVTSRDNRGMYFLVVIPKTETDCTRAGQGTQARRTFLKGCAGTSSDTAEDRTLAACEAAVGPGRRCQSQTTACTVHPSTVCVGEGTFPLQRERTYALGSQVDIAGSRLTATVAGLPASRGIDVRGRLHFDYDAITRRLHVQGMELDVDDVPLGRGTAADVEVSLAAPFPALPDHADPRCAAVPVGWPCPRYSVAPRTARIGVFYRMDGHPHHAVLENSGPVVVSVSGARGSAQRLTFRGAFASDLRFDDGSVRRVTLDLELDGTFLDFQPNPRTDESTTGVACVALRPDDGPPAERNAEPIVLSAAGSVQVNGRPDRARFTWLEDLGTPSEQVVGRGPDVTLPPGTVGFGSHHYTLVMDNPAGLSATDAHRVSVVDRQPPELWAADLVLLEPDPRFATTVELSASAADTCSTAALVPVSDPPGPLALGPGRHVVRWSVADRRGQVATRVQHIDVIGSTRDLAADLVAFVEATTRSLRESEQALHRCLERGSCVIDLAPQARALEGSLEVAAARGVDDDTLSTLALAAEELGEARRLLTADLDPAGAVERLSSALTVLTDLERP